MTAEQPDEKHEGMKEWIKLLERILKKELKIHLRNAVSTDKRLPTFGGQKVKVKVTLVQALRICTGRTAHRGSRGIALPFRDYGTRMG
jgi:arginine utilization protein RocB